MPERALRESLERLKAELAESGSLSDADRERLESLVAELGRRLERAADDEDDDEDSLADRLQEAKEHFEEEHPTLTFAIGAVAEALSRLGI